MRGLWSGIGLAVTSFSYRQTFATGMMDNTNRPHLQTTVQSRLVIKSNPDERVLSVPLPHNLIDK